MLRRRKPRFDAFEVHHRQTEELVAPPIALLDREADHLVRRVVGEVLVGDLGEGAVADQHQLAALVHVLHHAAGSEERGSRDRVLRCHRGPLSGASSIARRRPALGWGREGGSIVVTNGEPGG